jgi:phosphatidylglycerophosphate synthase
VQQRLQKKQLNKSLDAKAKAKPEARLEYLPSVLSMLRLSILPFFVYSFLSGLTLLGYSLFLFAVITDFADGYFAKKLQVTSRFGAYYDVTIDTLFIITMFGVFFLSGCYPYWVLLLILFMYAQFILTSFCLKITYDPVGKYYGSLLYGAIGLTLLFSGQAFYDFVTLAIVATTAVSVFSRLSYWLYSRKHKNKDSTQRGL